MKDRRNDLKLSTADVANAAHQEHETEMQDQPRRRDEEPRPKAADYEGNYSQRGARTEPATGDPPRLEREDRPRQEQDDAPGPLFPEQEVQDLRVRWDVIQTSFVDEPRQALQRADQLVAETITRLAETFAAERANLETQWDRGQEVSTEDLRQALKRYRSFYGRLLSM